MLAKLNLNATLTQTAANLRMSDIARLFTGAITSTSGLSSSAWDVANSYVNSSVPGTWNIWYQNLGTPDIATPGTGATWKVIFSKQSSQMMHKLTQFTLESSTTSVYPYTGVSALNASTMTNPSPSTISGSGNIALSLATAADSIIVGAHDNCAFLYSVSTGCLWCYVEKPMAIYDGNTTEGPGVYWWTKGATSCAYVSNMYVPSSKTYVSAAVSTTPHFNTNIITDTVAMTRDASRKLVSPMIPLYVEYLYSGWIGGSLTTGSDIYRTADASGSTWDSMVHNGKNYRILATGNLRYAVPDA